jgi:hypothetical protein
VTATGPIFRKIIVAEWIFGAHPLPNFGAHSLPNFGAHLLPIFSPNRTKNVENRSKISLTPVRKGFCVFMFINLTIPKGHFV